MDTTKMQWEEIKREVLPENGRASAEEVDPRFITEAVRRSVAEAEQALVSKPLHATSVERFLILDEWKSKDKELAHPVRFGRCLSDLLRRVSVPIEEYDLLAGRCVDRELTEEEEIQFQKFLVHPDYPGRRFFISSGHCTYSWEMVVEKGLAGLKEEAAGKREEVLNLIAAAENPGIDRKLQLLREKEAFYRGMVEIYSGIQSYLIRYAKAAEDQGMEQMAQRLLRAANGVPDSFACALQLLWIITLINCAYVSENPTLTVGRLDQILYPLYRADLEKGVLTKEEAKAYITDYYCKHNLIMGRGEHQVGTSENATGFHRILNFDAPQYLLLAGSDEKDSSKSVVNDLTELFAECINPSFKNPVVVVRYTKGMDRQYPTLWKLLCQKALQSASLMFYNDGNVLAAMERMGLPREDRGRYAHFGCNWCSPGDNSAWMLSGPRSSHLGVYRSEEEAKELDIPYMRTRMPHAWPEDFVEILRELAGRQATEEKSTAAGAAVTMEDFYELFFARMGEFVDRKLAYLSKEVAARKRRPSAMITFGDCFLEGSLESGECFSAGAKYHFELQSFQMFGTVADCFIAVDQLVMREKKLTLAQLLAAVEADFEGYEEELALCRKAEKFGMDTPLSNEHAQRLAKTAGDLVISKSRTYIEREKLLLVPCMQSDTWHLKMGEQYGATPDGRRAGASFSQNTRPNNGACVNGLTAMLQAMLQIPSDSLVSGALNLDVDPKQFAAQEGLDVFAAMLASYFNRGGLHAQVTCVDVKDLEDARVHPEQHRDLRVRVTGYSGVFVDICDRLQKDIIERLQ